MRYLSDDNKVFNDEAECREHERSLKEDAKKKEKQEEFAKLKKRYESIADLINKWTDDYEAYTRKYCDFITKEDKVDLNAFMDFLNYLFDDESNNKKNDRGGIQF